VVTIKARMPMVGSATLHPDSPEASHLKVLTQCTCPDDPCQPCDFARAGLSVIRTRRAAQIKESLDGAL